MPELTPLDDNRQEHFLNGEDLEPITRREHFYAGRESELPEGHQEPETREEWFIKKYRGGGGEIVVESLSVTENGDYTAPSGKAYNPVHVDVPLPSNAYLLKSVTTPTPIASFNDGEEMVMPTLKVAIEPQQDLHGYDAPWVGGAGKNKATDVFSEFTKPDNYYICPITLQEGHTYTIYATKTGQTVTDAIYGIVRDGDRYSNFVGQRNVVTTEGNVNNLTFTVDDTYVSPKLIFYGNESKFNSIFANYQIQLEESDQATSYAPYSNICPISGWSEANVTRTGKNLFDESILLECSGWAVSDGIYSGDSINVNAKYGNGVPNLAFKPNTQYTFSFTYGQDGSAGIGLAVVIRYADDTATPKYCNLDSIGSVSVTSTAGKSIKRIELSYGANRTIHLSNMQLEEGTTATTYEPYTGNTYEISLGSDTVYGARLNVTTGEMVVDRMVRHLKDISSWNRISSGSKAFYQSRNNALPGIKYPFASANTRPVSSAYPYSSDGTQGEGTFRVSDALYIVDNRFEKKSDFMSFLTTNDVTVLYYLDTPATVTLTPTEIKTLLAANNIWADTGDITDAEYFSKEV